MPGTTALALPAPTLSPQQGCSSQGAQGLCPRKEGPGGPVQIQLSQAKGSTAHQGWESRTLHPYPRRYAGTRHLWVLKPVSAELTPLV